MSILTSYIEHYSVINKSQQFFKNDSKWVAQGGGGHGGPRPTRGPRGAMAAAAEAAGAAAVTEEAGRRDYLFDNNHDLLLSSFTH